MREGWPGTKMYWHASLMDWVPIGFLHFTLSPWTKLLAYITSIGRPFNKPPVIGP